MSRDFYDDRVEGGGLIKKIAIAIAAAVGVVMLGGVGFLVVALQGLPDLDELKNYEPPITSRVHAGDGALVAEFAEEHRLFVPIETIPDRVRNAFIAAEDQNFFEHSGVDFTGVLRAAVSNVGNVMAGRRLEGASTITQQVAGNMLTGRASDCSSEKGVNSLVCALYTKVREGFTAQRIEQALSKERILELYLNQIYLGRRSYGVAAASLNYFNKPLSDLTTAEAAFLAVLPKGPANYNPSNENGMKRALARRSYVLGRMAEQGFIAAGEAQSAEQEPVRAVDRLTGDQYVAATHFVEDVRRQIAGQLGDDALLRGGLSIRSTIDTRLQLAAANAVRAGLEAYDRRHSWRGPVASGDPNGDVAAQLASAAFPPALTDWQRAMVIRVNAGVRIRLRDGTEGRLVDADAQWGQTGRRERRLLAGSIVYVSRVARTERYNLHQVPEIQGALVALDPHTGRVLAMVGGYDLAQRGYNRATQARRQPGSSFKPIVYAAALDQPISVGGVDTYVTPATLIDDGPFSVEAGDGSIWSPENYERDFLGPTPLRRGLELSRNAMTARVAYEMGIDRVVDYAKRMGVYENVSPVFALALGSGETTVIRMTAAYGEFVNGGRRITPIIVDRIQDRSGRTIFRADQRECANCAAAWARQTPPLLPDGRQQILDPITAHQVVSMTEGVVQRGTGAALKALERPLGGKTGTTSDYKDAWWIGYSPDLVVGVWAGFDTPRDMGQGETGARITVPIFADFMRVALRDAPPTPFRIPAGVRLVRIDRLTGGLPGPDATDTILEAFRPGTEPVRDSDSSPFIFGGTEPIDPRILTGLREELTAPPPSGPARERAGDDGLSGLY
jgi:penicillin-binding protein 1A